MSRRRATVPKLRRAPAQREPFPRVFIYCEGRNTEPEYIRDFCRDIRFTAAAIQQVGVPHTVVERAVEKVRELRREARRGRDSFGGSDEVWVIFDVDTHPRIADAVGLARNSGIHIALSNPCFELWGIYHFEECDAPNNANWMQRRLAQLLPSYDPEGAKRISYGMLRSEVDTAKTRAVRCLEAREREGDPLGNPCTTVHKLVIRLQELVEKT